ncbi:dTDP-glucose 4,6-dehydratase [Clostridium homopropionicum DSM 5847]|uniref:dTDP-glucose 4,6-dehydratase n=1 Tax=Clostridium homopropionicum DSM 5847 TaxID=1121318 RepID=A0A0L6ZDJ3_9CLOT|nr:NAD(P)-dependent oxidoreductase [Clostridium homopropionicum]KOA21035.1 dTDP-glucose 4,6-dehydratase [Clostridium homopropionicum DSM 5847]SFF98879.1 Nucleoside-diphosphate-sugar epimerase [Clostridium homopropionicum]
MKRYLITGATGLIGRYILKLINIDSEIYILNRNSNEINQNIKTIQIDLEKDWDENLLPKNIDTVIHLAQSEHYRDFPDYSEKIFSVNTFSTLKLLEYSRRNNVKNFIYASSGSVYNNVKSELESIYFNKEMSFYSATKICSEILCENYEKYMNIKTLRFFYVYGCNQKESMLIARLIYNIKNSIPIFISGDEGILINPIYAEDAAKAVLCAELLNKSEKINVGGMEILSLKYVADKIGEILNIKPKYVFNKDLLAENLTGDISKMIKILGEPQIPFNDGIRYVLKDGNL